MNLSESYKKRLQELAGVNSEKEFIYHGTNDGAAYHIQKSGKMKINAANNNEPYISFTSDMKVAKYYAEMKGDKYRAVVLRIMKTPDFSLSPKFEKNKGHEWITEREIPINEIEIETKEGWVPLEKWDIIDKKRLQELAGLDNENSNYPKRKDIISMLRNNLTLRVDYPVIGAFIIGSEAKGTAKEGSDLDIGIIIPKSNKISALKRTDNYHSKFNDDIFKPKWNGRIVDFQFFYEDDPEFEKYSKIKLF